MRGRNSRHYVDRSSRSHSFAPRVAGVMLLAGALALLGCASTQGDPMAGRDALQPLGPGHVFSSVEAAVVDAMAFSLTDARRTSKRARMYGGSIKAVDGGFTYDEPTVASPHRPLDIRYKIGRTDVARFHVYPKAYDLRESRAREHVTRWDKQSVDSADPRHRPLYFLTPSLVVKAYHGKASSLPTQEIARLDRVSKGVSVEMIASTATVP